jgi:hypothetical protein
MVRRKRAPDLGCPLPLDWHGPGVERSLGSMACTVLYCIPPLGDMVRRKRAPDLGCLLPLDWHGPGVARSLGFVACTDWQLRPSSGHGRAGAVPAAVFLRRTAQPLHRAPRPTIIHRRIHRQWRLVPRHRRVLPYDREL